MARRLRIHAITEVPIGTDEIIATLLRQERLSFGVSIVDVAEATGAHAEEIAALEQGAISAFADHGRLRSVILAYCDYLEIDPTPLLARLESYARWQTLASPNLFADNESRLSPRLSRAIVALFIFAMLASIALVLGLSY